jgi:hypothetical protein
LKMYKMIHRINHTLAVELYSLSCAASRVSFCQNWQHYI